MNSLGAASDAAPRYTRFRRFLVENATTQHLKAVPIALDVGLDLAELYEEIPASVCVELDSAAKFYPCPRCRWPMQIGREVVRCAHSDACMEAGARFARHGGRLVPLGKLNPPDAVAQAGHARLLFGVWRYTTLPGLEELDLRAKLMAIPGVKVELWPMVDRYDLDLTLGKHRWRVDVKDHASVARLAMHLRDRPAPEKIWIVVPERHHDQVLVLRRLCSGDAGYLFASSKELPRLVRRAAKTT
ncbi:MAG: hypothetical protein ACREXK_14450 [Gammaproteobacteria bacterium]